MAYNIKDFENHFWLEYRCKRCSKTMLSYFPKVDKEGKSTEKEFETILAETHLIINSYCHHCDLTTVNELIAFTPLEGNKKYPLVRPDGTIYELEKDL